MQTQGRALDFKGQNIFVVFNVHLKSTIYADFCCDVVFLSRIITIFR